MALAAHRIAGKMRGQQHSTLRTQLVRAAMSVPTNIVEGRAQRSDKEFGRFLRVAFGSATELEYHLIMGNEIGAISYADFEPMLAQVIDVKKMLTGLINRLERAQFRSKVKADSKEQ
jgi:four helix bundle protein